MRRYSGARREGREHDGRREARLIRQRQFGDKFGGPRTARNEDGKLAESGDPGGPMT